MKIPERRESGAGAATVRTNPQNCVAGAKETAGGF